MGHSVAGRANGFQERPSTAATLFLRLRGLRFELFIPPIRIGLKIWYHQYPLANHHVPHVKTSCNEFAGYTAVSNKAMIWEESSVCLSVLTSSPRLLSSLRPSLQWKLYTRCCPRRNASDDALACEDVWKAAVTILLQMGGWIQEDFGDVAAGLRCMGSVDVGCWDEDRFTGEIRCFGKLRS